MYYIQGADQKEYGPVSADQLRQWISENRLNRFSPARAEGETLWKTLGDFPEFAEALGTSAPPAAPEAPTAHHAGPQAAHAYPGFRPSASGLPEAAVDEQLRVPTIGILVTGVLGTFLSLYGVFASLTGSAKKTEIPSGMGSPEAERMVKSLMGALEAFNLPLNLMALLMGVLTLLAGIKMLQRRSYTLVMIGVIVGMLPCLSPCCCTGLPFGIWALVLLTKPEIRDSFR